MVNNTFAIIFEFLGFFVCSHIIFKEKIKINISNISLFAIYLFICLACTYSILPSIAMLILFLYTFIWTHFSFKNPLIKSIIKTIILYVAYTVIQYTSIMLVYIFMKIKDIDTVQILSCLFSVFILVLVYCVSMRQDVKNKHIVINKKMFVHLIIVCLFLIYLKVNYEANRSVTFSYYFFAIISVLIGVYGVVKEQLVTVQYKNRKKEEYLNNIYSEKYNELIEKIRARQHDYSNQLTTMQSMHVAAKSLDDLITMQNDYLGVIEEERKYDSILTKCNDRVLAGYIYSLSLQYEEKNINLNSDINISSSKVPIPIIELTEILGIILNNAYEKIISDEVLDKTIELRMTDSENILNIEVRNPSEYITFSEISKMFEYGYSTKGKDRGLGLYRVKKIVEKYNGEIDVSNITDQEVNKFVMKIILKN